jgi:Pin2-interacting protein X1
LKRGALFPAITTSTNEQTKTTEHKTPNIHHTQRHKHNNAATMTIVSTADTRNSAWSQNTSSYGRKMLEKMGWKGDDHGLGKNQQGTTNNLRAIRRAESLGIGAETDAFGDKGWDNTSKGYAGVLASLQKEYGVDNNNEKKEKKRKRKDEKRAKAKGESSDDGTPGMRLAQNKVQAGHARKMRVAKDIRNKSAEDMAAVFGVKADFYKGFNNACIKTGESEKTEDVKEKKSSKKRNSRKDDGVVDEMLNQEGERQKKKKRKDKKSKA